MNSSRRGAPDVGEHVNLNRIVQCKMLRDDYWPSRRKKGLAPWPKRVELSGKPETPDFEDYVKQLSEVMRKDPDMQACIERIKYLDKNDTAYQEVIAHPFLHDNVLGGVFNISRLGKGLREVIDAAQAGYQNKTDAEKTEIKGAVDATMAGVWPAAIKQVNDIDHKEKRRSENATAIVWSPAWHFANFAGRSWSEWRRRQWMKRQP